MSLWTLDTLASAAGGQRFGGTSDTPVSGISIDTRTLSPGEAYFAITGVSMDGHRFVDAALERGAAAAVVNRGEQAPAIRVEGDVLKALERVGVTARARIAADTPVVAVTGSVGKTGTKEMLRLAFGAGTHAAAASFNNHWGVPLTLARMPAGTRAGIFEIGMNHAGEITPLTQMVRPTIAIITTVGAAHLEFFPSVEAIADAKAEIFAGLEPGGTAILPADNPHFARLRAAAEAAGASVLTFAGEDADIRLAAFDPVTGRAMADVLGTQVAFTIHGGAHIARNALAVLGALHAAGRPLVDIAALETWQAAKGRGRRANLVAGEGELVLLDEAYNANPASMAAAIGMLGATPAARRVAILGDMLELGSTAPELHRGLAPFLIEADTRIVHTVGAMMTHLAESLPAERRGVHAPDAASLAAALPALEPGDAVLVKASNAMGLARVVEAIEARHARRTADDV
ncbi:MAG: UDP-N-acetylmuramoylalanyl-D-glutamyl-2,6-diaminopimelate--D-alanyl-D-alanine ligase [Acuticoccus sp.]